MTPEQVGPESAQDLEADDLRTWSGSAAEPTQRPAANGTTGTAVQPGTSSTLATPPTAGPVGSPEGSKVERRALAGSTNRDVVSSEEIERRAERQRRALEAERNANQASATPPAAKSDERKKKESGKANDPTNTAPRREKPPTESDQTKEPRSSTRAADSDASSKPRDNGSSSQKQN